MQREDAMSAGVSVEVESRVALLRLQEPETMNALSPTIKAGLEREVPRLIEDPGLRAIVVTGAGKAFCAGGDIRAMTDRRPAAVKTRLERNWIWARSLVTCDKPVLMAVNGAAAGAGFALAMLGDIVIAASDARFKAGFAGLGAVPDMGLGYTLPRLIGLQRAREILLTNRTVEAEEALRLGMVSRIAEPAALLPETMALARLLADGPAIAIGLTKSMVRRAFDDTLERFLEDEAKAQAIAFASEDFAEGVAAFLEKRRAVFKGA